MTLSFAQLMKVRMHDALLRFRKGIEGTMTVEMVIMLPFLFWMITTSYELFEVHRYKAARIKATYTVADLLSREMTQADDDLLNTAKSVFDDQTVDDGTTQVRMSLVRYEGGPNGPQTYDMCWSELRGTGPMQVLTDADVATAHATLPILDNGEEMLIVESTSIYQPTFIYPGLNNQYTVNTRVFTGVRFIPQLCWNGNCGC